MTPFRERILARRLDRHAISPELVQKLLGWRDPGFSAHAGESIPRQERQRLEDTAAYLVRTPLSLRKLVYLDGQQAVLYRSRMNPSLGRNFEALDPLEWLARMSDHIPDPGQHRTILYGQYANRVRGARRRDESEWPEASAEPPRRRCSPTWARLIAKIYQVDPLVCTSSSRSGRSSTTSSSARRPRTSPRPSARSSASPSTARVGACRPTGSRPHRPSAQSVREARRQPVGPGSRG
jgi:hypothetical protein